MSTLVLHPIRMTASENEDDDLLIDDNDINDPSEGAGFPGEEQQDDQQFEVGGDYHENDGGEAEQF